MSERYFECKRCGQVVQGFHAVNEWYSKPCIGGKNHKWKEIVRDGKKKKK